MCFVFMILNSSSETLKKSVVVNSALFMGKSKFKNRLCGRNLDAELAEHVLGEMDVHRFGTSNPKWTPKGMNPKVDNPKQM